MRYRPFGRSGVAVSALTLKLDSTALAWGPEAARRLVFGALESGINTFHIAADPVLAEVVGQAVASVDRRLICVSLALGSGGGRRGDQRDFTAEGLTGAIDRVLQVSGLQWLDLAMLDEPGADELSQSALNAMKAQRSSGRVRLLGVSGVDEVMDAYVSTNAFDVMATPYHVNSPWQVRARIRAALERDMAVLAYGTFPDTLSTRKKAETVHEEPKKKGLFGFGGSGSQKRAPNDPLSGAGTFAFLHRTNGWEAEDICLAFSLTDPGIASVIVEAQNTERLEQLASVPDRDLPAGISAQIEMARVRAAHAA